MKTIHLVYPCGPRISSPHSIGRHLAQALSSSYRVEVHRLELLKAIRPISGDVLLGHPHQVAGTCFRRSMKHQGWSRVITMCPFNGDPGLVSYLDSSVVNSDLFLAISGPFWFNQVVKGPYASWLPRMVRLDMAVDRIDFPRVRARLAPPGKRRFVYIGNTSPTKNTGYLSEIARRLPHMDFAWIGAGGEIPGVRSLGYADFSTDAGRRLVSEFDFMVTVGRMDANPTTVLEAMSWGLLPVCTPQSGYMGEPGIPNVPLDDLNGACCVLQGLQEAPTPTLDRLRAINDEALDSRFSWGRFATTVESAIEGTERPALGERKTSDVVSMRRAYWTGLNSPLRWWVLRDLAKANLRAAAVRYLPRLLGWWQRLKRRR